jgi:hypothetical protein
MDALSSILEITKLSGLVCDKLFVSEPWGLDVIQNENAQFWRLLKGTCTVTLLDGITVAMEEGDIVIVPHGASHWIGDHASSRRATTVDFINARLSGKPVFDGPGKETVLVSGYFSFDKQQTHPFLRDLPPIIRISRFGTRHENYLNIPAG